MVARKPPDWLPSGWTVEFKVQKTGRKIRIYTNLETGEKLFSKDDVIHRIKVNSSEGRKPLPKNRHIKMHSRNNPKPLVVETNEHPEWLPKGWNVEVKARNNVMGAKYKCYIDPLTACRFYSKPQVFRYLKSVKRCGQTFRKGKIDIGKPLIYANLETGEKLFSKYDVIHRIKFNSSKGRKPLPKHRHIKRHSRNNPKPLAAETNEHPEWLPKGWNVEVKARNNGMGAKYKCYIDPLTACRFYSKPQVFRYLESVKRCSQTFRKRKIDIGKPLPPAAVKRQKLNHPETRRKLFADRGGFIMRGSELAEAKSSKRGRANKASAEQRDAYAPAAEIVQDKHSMKDIIKDSSAKIKENCRPRRSSLLKADSSNGKSQPKSFPPNNMPVSTPAVDILQENDGLKTVKENGSIRKSKITPSKSKKKKEFKMPSRSSKRLAGFEPEQVVNSVLSEQPFQLLTRRFSESGAGQDSGLARCGLSNGASQQPDNGQQQMVNAQHGSTDLSHELHGEPSDESKKHLQNEDASKGPLEMLETDKLDDEVPEQEHCCPFGNSWSDPCLEFAIKTLTGALPLEETTSYGAVLAPAAVIQQIENSLEGGTKRSSTRKTQDSLKKSKNKKDLNLPRRSSKRLAGLEPEMVANSRISERAIQNARSKSYESEATLPVILADGASQQLVDRLDMELAHHVSNSISAPILGESSNKSEKPLEVQVGPKEQLPLVVQSVTKEQPHFPETEIMPEPQLAFPFGDSWPDPCLEFAFKTLTGAIPVEDHLAVQGSFQEELDISHTQRDGSLALPDFGLPSFFQNDISSHFDLPEKSMAGHQPSRSSSFLTPGNVSFPSYGGISSQQPCSEGDKDLHGKVNS